MVRTAVTLSHTIQLSYTDRQLIAVILTRDTVNDREVNKNESCLPVPKPRNPHFNLFHFIDIEETAEPGHGLATERVVDDVI